MDELFLDYLYGRSTELFDVQNLIPELEIRYLNDFKYETREFSPICSTKIEYVVEEIAERYPNFDFTKYVLEEVYLVIFPPLETIITSDEKSGHIIMQLAPQLNNFNAKIYRKLALRAKDEPFVSGCNHYNGHSDNIIVEN